MLPSKLFLNLLYSQLAQQIKNRSRSRNFQFLFLQQNYLQKQTECPFIIIFMEPNRSNYHRISDLPLRPQSSYSWDKWYDPRNTDNLPKNYKPGHVLIHTNHYKVQTKNVKCIYLYRILMTPKIQGLDRSVTEKIIQQFYPKIYQYFHNPVCSGFILYTTQETRWKQSPIILNEHSGTIYTITFQLFKTLVFNDPSVNEKAHLIFLNSLLRDSTRRLGYRDGFKNKRIICPCAQDITDVEKVRVHDAYVANFSKLRGGLFLKIDAFKIVMTNMDVLEWIREYFNCNRHIDKQERNRIMSEKLEKKFVITRYGNKRQYRIQKVRWDLRPQKAFLNGDRYQTSVSQYYKQRYNLQATSNQPLLEIKTKKQKNVYQISYLCPEYCTLCDISPIDFDTDKTQIIRQKAKMTLNQKVYNIKVLRAGLDQQQDVKEARTSNLKQKRGIDIGDSLYSFQTHKIQEPVIQLGFNKYVQMRKQTSFNLSKSPLYDTSKEINVAIIHSHLFNKATVQAYLKDISASMNIRFQHRFHEIEQTPSNYPDILKQQLQHLKTKNRYNIYLIVIPDFQQINYKKLKKQCCQNLDIMTQFCLNSTIADTRIMYPVLTKLLLQMAAKVGNVLWSPITDYIKRKIMIIGVSCGRERVDQKKIVSYCASLNNNFSKFHFDVSYQDFQSPTVENMENILTDCFSAYLKQNETKVLPEEVIIIRSGIPRDGYQQLLNLQIKSTITAIQKTKEKIRLTYIVMDKNPPQKFFKKSQNDKFINVPSGTIINEHVVENGYHNFYMVSQHFIERKLSIPTYYKILYSDSEIQKSNIERVIYHQCFNYFNTTGSIKLPSINQYAKKQSEFVAMLGVKPEGISKNLYFI